MGTRVGSENPHLAGEACTIRGHLPVIIPVFLSHPSYKNLLLKAQVKVNVGGFTCHLLRLLAFDIDKDATSV